MPELIAAVLFTVLLSAFCSTIEAMLLSTTPAEIEALKARLPKVGAALEQCREQLDESISAILTFNTIANTLGSFICGALALKLFPSSEVAFAVGMTVGVLVFGEILPKNVGVIFRVRLHPVLVWALQGMRGVARPMSWLMSPLIKLILRRAPEEADATEEIALLAEKEAKEGNLTPQESNLITNALKLDDVIIRDIMTPRSVVHALEKSRTVGDVFRETPNIPFARIPVYGGALDNIVGYARRRDLLKAKAADQDHNTVGDLMHQPIVAVSETATAATVLQQFLKAHQQMAVVVDERGMVSGVVSMEDVFEHLLGAEIFEKDDVAVDMRELARRRQRATSAPPISSSPIASSAAGQSVSKTG